jgi:hypothetical protein
MIPQDVLKELPISPRTSNHRAQWCPLYLEPLPGSGERVCIGVVGVDETTFAALPVPNLNRLASVYSKGSQSFEWAAKLALLEIQEIVGRNGIDRLNLEMHGFEGFCAGEKRIGAGRDLQDLLSLALRQSSAIAAASLPADSEGFEVAEVNRAGPIAGAVKRIVVGLRPQLRANFGLEYRFSKTTRPTAFGFVGRRIVANFTSLGGDSAKVLAAQVDRAKARLWDLEQLQKGVLHDSLGVPMRHASFELLACPPALSSKTSGPRRQIGSGQILEAAETLEKEADKFDIRWRLLKSPLDVAHTILAREAA